MSNSIKTGRHIKRFKRYGKKSDAFMAKTQPGLQTPLEEGTVAIYLDDERVCPPGWTLARNPKEFFDLLKPEAGYLDRIEYLSLDWHLGSGWDDGEVVAQQLVDRFVEDENFLPNLISIGLHSSKRDAQISMDKILAKGLPEKRLNELYVQWGTPRLERLSIPPSRFL